MVTVLKLGGSVITDKDRPETVDSASVDRAAATIADSPVSDAGLVLVHGGGSFGHHRASKHGLSESRGSADATTLLDIHEGMGELNDAVLASLHEHDISALPVRPLSVGFRDGDGRLSFAAGQLEAMLAEGFVPVVHGDVVVQTGQGGTILSGDEIVATLARSLGANRVGLCSTVPGVLDAEGAVIPEIRSVEAVADSLGESETTDVTGGMAGKVERMLSLKTPASVFGLEDLQTFLSNGTAGTIIR